MLIVIQGSDEFRKNRRRKVETQGYECTKIADWGDAYNQCLTPGLFGKQAIIHEPKSFEIEDPATLEPLLTCQNLLVVMTTKVDGRKKLGKWLKKQEIIAEYNLYPTWYGKRDDLIGCIRGIAKTEFDMELDHHILNYLIDANGADLGRTQESLRLIKAYYQDEKPNIFKVVELVPSLASTSYDLALAITGTGLPQEVFAKAKTIMDIGYHPLQVLTTVLNRIQKLMTCAVCNGAEMERPEIAKLITLKNEKALFYLINEAADIGSEKLIKAYSEISNLIHQYKTGNWKDEHLALELTIIAHKM